MNLLGLDMGRLLKPRRSYEQRAAEVKGRCDKRSADAKARGDELRRKAGAIESEARASVREAHTRAATLREEAAEVRASRRFGPRGAEDDAKAAALESQAGALVTAALEAQQAAESKATTFRCDADAIEAEATAAAGRDDAELERAQRRVHAEVRARGTKALVPVLTSCLRALSRDNLAPLIDACEAIHSEAREQCHIHAEHILKRAMLVAVCELCGDPSSEFEDPHAARHWNTEHDRIAETIVEVLTRGYSPYGLLRVLVDLAEFSDKRRAVHGLPPLTPTTAAPASTSAAVQPAAATPAPTIATAAAQVIASAIDRVTAPAAPARARRGEPPPAA